jgi:quercetin dioxygenase-like cupin family protein
LEGEVKMATLIKKHMQRSIGPGFPIGVRIGIDKNTVKNPEAAMAHLTVAPGGGSRRHYHLNPAFIYILKGRLRWFVGPHSEEVDVEAGDFLYFPPGEIHGHKNLSDTEPVEEIVCYVGVPSFEDSGAIDVENLWEKSPK